uniref:Uncharacterized protein n=1 Tax=Oryza glumipatula TaxID=40148 RepID=A0A0D9YGW8_9ORYZ
MHGPHGAVPARTSNGKKNPPLTCGPPPRRPVPSRPRRGGAHLSWTSSSWGDSLAFRLHKRRQRHASPLSRCGEPRKRRERTARRRRGARSPPAAAARGGPHAVRGGRGGAHVTAGGEEEEEEEEEGGVVVVRGGGGRDRESESILRAADKSQSGGAFRRGEESFS